MAPSTSLRAITHRLTTTPVKDLPHVAAFLAASLSDCGDILSASQGQGNASSDSGNALQVTKLKARLTSLLQDRSFEGRWTAVVLVKAAIEAGQWEILRECEAWVRGLLGILSKPDSLSTKKLSIVTLTRIFHLTYQYPTLLREITTPSLPSFITASLNLISIKPSSEPHRTLKEDIPLLETVLHSFNDLIGRHPTIFRSFSAQVHSLLLPIVGSSATSGGSLSRSVINLSQKLFISLHNCAPKNTGGGEWENTCRYTIASIHQAADHTFRSIIEQWESTDPNLRRSTSPGDASQVVGDQGRDALGLPEWQGIHAGADRLTTLLCLLSGFMSTRTALTVNVPIGAILDVTSRLLSVTVPKDGEDGAVQANTEISRDEREALWMELPRIHSACINLFSNITNTLETAVIPIAQNMIEQTLWVFDAEGSHSKLRASSYRLLEQLLPLVGRSTTKANVAALAVVIRQCCHDVLPPDTGREIQRHDTKGKAKGSQGSTNVDVFLNPGLKGASPSTSTVFHELQSTSSRLLPIFFHHVPTGFIPLPVRTELDRTAILTGNHDAMMASVMNPVPPTKGRRPIPSILPFLTRQYPKQQDVECLLRPRMPVLLGTFAGGTLEQEVEDEDDDYEEEEEEEESTRIPAVETQIASTHHVFETTSLARTVTSQGPSPTGVVAGQTLTKRTLPEDIEMSDQHSPPLLPSRAGDQNSPEPKKARLESSHDTLVSIPQSKPVTLTEAAASPTIGPSVVSAPLEPAASDRGVLPVPTSVASRVQSADVRQMSRATAGDEDSDGEIPTLNIEPDTDDEDDDDDDDDDE